MAVSPRPPAPTSSYVSPPPPPPASPRERFMPDSRQTAVAEVRASLEQGRSVLVVGEAGVGKTAVAARALDHLTLGGDERALVVALSGAAARDGMPLAALEPLLGDDGLLTLGSFARTVRALGESLTSSTHGGPVVLRVDDAHLLDDASAQALSWVVRQGDVLMVATTRPSGASGSPWLELWKDDVVERVDLAPFTAAEIEQWLTAELGGPTTVDTVRRIWGETRGNIFHARELVRSERASGGLKDHGGVWVWTGRGAPGGRLLELVENDTARLSPEGRRALEVVALLCPAPLSMLLDVVPRTAVDELVHTGVATLRSQVSDAGGSDVVVDLAHSLYAEAVRAGVPGGRRREVLDLVASSLHTVSGASLVRSVALALDSGIAVGLPRLQAAIDSAFAVGQADVVVRLVDVALRTVAVGAPGWAELVLWRAEAWWSLDELARAERDALEVLDVLRPVAVVPLPAEVTTAMVRAAQLVAVAVQYQDHELDEAIRPLDETRAWLAERAGPGQWEAELAAADLVRAGFAGQLAETRDEALAVLADARIPGAVVRLVCPTVIGLGYAGRYAEARALSARYLPVALAHLDHYRWAPGEIAIGMFSVQMWSGELGALGALGEDLEGEGVVLDWVAAQASRGLVAMAQGSWSQAAADLRAANARSQGGDRGGASGYTGAAEALAAAAAGNATLARQLLDILPRRPLRASALFGAEIRLLRVDTLAWLRDPGTRVEAESLAIWARGQGYHRIELEALHRCLRAGASASDVVDRVAELALLVEGPRAEAVAQHVAALASSDDDLARIAERDLNRCGLWLPPVETAIALTPREREIAGLAAGGMTSRAIATRLTLSVRTVDSHLARVFAKTGVHSREGLSGVLR